MAKAPKASVLVVDDEVYMEKLIKMRFRREISKKQYDFQYALNGQDALNVLKDHTDIDIILCDINMPVMDGLEATTALKADAATSAIPIVALTAYALGEDEDKILEAGCDAYLAKPIDFKALLAKIREFLGE